MHVEGRVLHLRREPAEAPELGDERRELGLLEPIEEVNRRVERTARVGDGHHDQAHLGIAPGGPGEARVEPHGDDAHTRVVEALRGRDSELRDGVVGGLREQRAALAGILGAQHAGRPGRARQRQEHRHVVHAQRGRERRDRRVGLGRGRRGRGRGRGARGPRRQGERGDQRDQRDQGEGQSSAHAAGVARRRRPGEAVVGAHPRAAVVGSTAGEQSAGVGLMLPACPPRSPPSWSPARRPARSRRPSRRLARLASLASLPKVP